MASFPPQTRRLQREALTSIRAALFLQELQANGDRKAAVTAPSSRDDEQAVSWMLHFTELRRPPGKQQQRSLPRCVTEQGLPREKHESVYVGWIPELRLGREGRRVSSVTGSQGIVILGEHMLVTFHRMRGNSLESRM